MRGCRKDLRTSEPGHESHHEPRLSAAGPLGGHRLRGHGRDLASAGNPSASEAWRAGGNAADAAVTAVAVLCVVEPQMTGIGGDCFCMLHVPGQPVWGYNGSGRAGARASLEALMARGISALPGDSIPAVTL